MPVFLPQQTYHSLWFQAYIRGHVRAWAWNLRLKFLHVVFEYTNETILGATSLDNRQKHN